MSPRLDNQPTDSPPSPLVNARPLKGMPSACYNNKPVVDGKGQLKPTIKVEAVALLVSSGYSIINENATKHLIVNCIESIHRKGLPSSLPTYI